MFRETVVMFEVSREFNGQTRSVLFLDLENALRVVTAGNQCRVATVRVSTRTGKKVS